MSAWTGLISTAIPPPNAALECQRIWIQILTLGLNSQSSDSEWECYHCTKLMHIVICSRISNCWEWFLLTVYNRLMNPFHIEAIFFSAGIKKGHSSSPEMLNIAMVIRQLCCLFSYHTHFCDKLGTFSWPDGQMYFVVVVVAACPMCEPVCKIHPLF